jgi:hypothetical protein
MLTWHWLRPASIAGVLALAVLYLPVGLGSPYGVVSAGGCGNSCSPAPAPPPGGTATTQAGYYAWGSAAGTFPAIDQNGTSSTGPGASYVGGPTACQGYYYNDSTALLAGYDDHWSSFNPSYPMNGFLAWGASARTAVFGGGGRVQVDTNNYGAVLLSEYDVYADYYQPLMANPNTASGQPPCVNNGQSSLQGLLANPVCPQAGAALCAGPDPTSSQVAGMEAYITDQLSGTLAGGKVTTAPASDALVNLPTYAWLAGANLPLDTSLSGSQISNQFWDGRSLVLTVTGTLSLEGVEWCWGDGQCTFASGPDGTGAAYPAGSLSHTYYDVSVYGEHPTPFPIITKSDQIPITAYAVETLTATLAWIYPWGSTGTETLPSQTMYVRALGAGVSSVSSSVPSQATLLKGAAWVVVGQVEGIPYCPTTTSCS